MEALSIAKKLNFEISFLCVQRWHVYRIIRVKASLQQKFLKIDNERFLSTRRSHRVTGLHRSSPFHTIYSLHLSFRIW